MYNACGLPKFSLIILDHHPTLGSNLVALYGPEQIQIASSNIRSGSRGSSHKCVKTTEIYMHHKELFGLDWDHKLNLASSPRQG